MPRRLNRDVLTVRIVMLAALAIGAVPIVALAAAHVTCIETTAQAGAAAPVNLRASTRSVDGLALATAQLREQ